MGSVGWVTVGVSYPTFRLVGMDQLPVLDPPMPQAVEHLGFEPELAAAWEHQAAARRAEGAVADRPVGLHEIGWWPSATAEGGIPDQEAVRDAHLEASMLLGVSDMTAGVILDAAGFARNHLPATWEAFHTGLIDFPRLRKIVDAGCELDDHVLALVDAAAAEQAAARSTSDFAHWLARYIAKTDFEAYERLTRTTRTRRHVQFAHLPNGMSIVSAFLPTIEAAAIEKRLKIITRRQHSAAKDTAAQEPQHRAVGPRIGGLLAREMGWAVIPRVRPVSLRRWPSGKPTCSLRGCAPTPPTSRHRWRRRS